LWLGLRLEWPMGLADALAAAAVLAVAAVAWRASHRPPVGLAWDGQAWALGGRPGRAQLMIDLDTWILLRFRPDAAPRRGSDIWLGVGAGASGPAWHGLRVALYAWRPEGPTAPARGPSGGQARRT
jgi:hypothetical protein